MEAKRDLLLGRDASLVNRQGEVGCVFDEISNLVEPTERPPKDGRAG
jgi:hypothetical protein